MENGYIIKFLLENINKYNNNMNYFQQILPQCNTITLKHYENCIKGTVPLKSVLVFTWNGSFSLN
jgi:hypothetical protein